MEGVLLDQFGWYRRRVRALLEEVAYQWPKQPSKICPACTRNLTQTGKNLPQLGRQPGSMRNRYWAPGTGDYHAYLASPVDRCVRVLPHDGPG